MKSSGTLGRHNATTKLIDIPPVHLWPRSNAIDKKGRSMTDPFAG
jgi:hypothetical protein